MHLPINTSIIVLDGAVKVDLGYLPREFTLEQLRSLTAGLLTAEEILEAGTL